MKKNISFEEAIRRLEELVAALEGGELSLEESLTAFEEAVALIKTCNGKINTAEQKVKILLEGADGSITDTPFEQADET